MKFLLDTHILLWWLADDPCLCETARDVIADESSVLFVSAATVWEIAIKKAAGKLEAPDDLALALEVNRFKALPITIPHAEAAGRLPQRHPDPFDRMLVAQAQIERMRLLTHDRRLTLYGEFVELV